MSKTGRVEIENFARRELPSGYTQVEYLQSSGTQYIDTGFVPNQDTRVVLDAQYKTTPSKAAFMYGARTGQTSNTYCLLWRLATGYFRSDYGTSNTQEFSGTNITTRYIFDKNKESTTINGVTQSYDYEVFECPCNLTLFGVNTKGTFDTSQVGTLKIYSCQIYDNGTLARDFVPCINAEGTAGMYELVDDIFYGNAGSGTFITGDIYRCYGLIYDREQADVDRVAYLIGRWRDGSITDMEKAEWAESMKGAYNAGDLNRVGAAVNYVAAMLTEWGYPYAPNMRTNWTASELFYAADLAEYLAAVEGLRARLAAFTDTPETPDKISTWQQANDIERIIEDVHLLLQNMVAGLPYADVIYSGAYPF